jgi:predicted HicB family RNase H-like nuclease
MKKDFKASSNPAMQFISRQKVAPAEQVPALDSYETEKRSKRMNLLITPTAAEQLRTLAAINKTSTNSLVNSIIEDYIAQHEDELQKYADLFGTN